MNIWKARTLAALTTASIIGLVILAVAFPYYAVIIGFLVLLAAAAALGVAVIYKLAMLWWYP